MRVCIVYGDYPPKPPGTNDGGADFVAELANRLARRGVGVSVIVSRRPDRLLPYVTRTGVQILPLIEDWGLGAAVRGQSHVLRNGLRSVDADVVHLVYPDPYLRYGTDSYHLPFLLKFAGAKRLVVTFFGFAVTGGSVVTKLGPIALFITANKVIITDQALHRRFQRSFPFWAHKSRVGFVGSIANSEARWSVDELGRRRADVGLDPSDRLAGFFGFWSPDKGLEELIQAIRLLRTSGEMVKLVLIGGREESLRTTYEQSVSTLLQDLRGSVVETGPLSARDVARYLLAMDLCVLPFRINPLGRSSLAIALTLGVPTVVSRPRVGAEFLRGLAQFEPGDHLDLMRAIRSVLTDRAVQVHVGAAATAAAAHWSWDSIIEAYLADYREVGAT
jgi:glycosyltransferase involved in cell wall biosynthesis